MMHNNEGEPPRATAFNETSCANTETHPVSSCEALPDPQAALEHALPHAAVSQVLRPEAAEFLPSGRVKILTLHDSQCCVTALTLKSATQDDMKLTVRFAESLPKLTCVEMLCTRFAEIEDATVAAIVQLPTVRSLTVSGAYLRPSLVTALAATQLTRLHLRDGTWIDDGLSRLSELPQLTDLDVFNPAKLVDGGHVPDIAKMQELQHLNVGLRPNTDATKSHRDREYFRSIATLSNLRSLSLSSRALNAESLALLCELPVLSALCLSHCRGVTPAALVFLFKNNRLEELDLSGCSGVTNEAVGPLFVMPRLRRLDVSNTGITTLAGIQTSPRGSKSQLQELVASAVIDDEITGITSLDRLRCLKISGTRCFQADPKAIAIVSQTLTQLRELHLTGSNLESTDFEPLPGLTQLHKISLSACHISSWAIRHLTPLKNLRVFHYVESPSWNSFGLLSEVVKLTQLHELKFHSKLTSSRDLALLSPLRQLVVLDFSCSPRDVACLRHLHELPQLQTLTIAGGLSAHNPQLVRDTIFREFPKLRSVSFDN